MSIGKSKPVWGGPCEEGITQSMLKSFLHDRERFRVYVVEGLKPTDKFKSAIEFGNMWHVCEEHHAKEGNWRLALQDYVEELCEKYPFSQDEIGNWAGICLVQFPLYVDYWKTHPDMQKRTPLLQEEVFNVPYKLPSGRVVKLRGKWDSVDLVEGEIWLMENKTKSDVDAVQIQRQLAGDLQVMLYLIALREYQDDRGDDSQFNRLIRGVRYNVIRRPRQYQGKKESREEFQTRLSGIIAEKPGEFFYRWNVDITPEDIERFKVRCLNPILESVCNWWAWVSKVRNPFGLSHGMHYQMPFGCHDRTIDEVDEYIINGSTIGLQKVDTLFPELEEAKQ